MVLHIAAAEATHIAALAGKSIAARVALKKRTEEAGIAAADSEWLVLGRIPTKAVAEGVAETVAVVGLLETDLARSFADSQVSSEAELEAEDLLGTVALK